MVGAVTNTPGPVKREAIARAPPPIDAPTHANGPAVAVCGVVVKANASAVVVNSRRVNIIIFLVRRKGQNTVGLSSRTTTFSVAGNYGVGAGASASMNAGSGMAA